MAWVRIFGVALLLGGAGLLALSWHLAGQKRQFRAAGVRTTGVVEGLVHHTYPSNNPGRSPRGGTTSSTAPTIRYHDAQGHTYVFTPGDVASRPTLFRVGEQVPVYYDPARPWQAQVYAPVLSSLSWVVPGIMGVVVAGLGLLCLLVFGRGLGERSSGGWRFEWGKTIR